MYSTTRGRKGAEKPLYTMLGSSFIHSQPRMAEERPLTEKQFFRPLSARCHMPRRDAHPQQQPRDWPCNYESVPGPRPTRACIERILKPSSDSPQMRPGFSELISVRVCTSNLSVLRVHFPTGANKTRTASANGKRNDNGSRLA